MDIDVEKNIKLCLGCGTEIEVFEPQYIHYYDVCNPTPAPLRRWKYPLTYLQHSYLMGGTEEMYYPVNICSRKCFLRIEGHNVDHESCQGNCEGRCRCDIDLMHSFKHVKIN